MKKFFIIVVILGFASYWVSAHGVYMWYEYQLEEAVEQYYEQEGYYPVRLEDLTTATYTENDQEKRYMTDLPPTPSGHRWEYDSSAEDRVKLVEED